MYSTQICVRIFPLNMGKRILYKRRPNGFSNGPIPAITIRTHQSTWEGATMFLPKEANKGAPDH